MNGRDTCHMYDRDRTWSVPIRFYALALATVLAVGCSRSSNLPVIIDIGQAGQISIGQQAMSIQDLELYTWNLFSDLDVCKHEGQACDSHVCDIASAEFVLRGGDGAKCGVIYPVVMTLAATATLDFNIAYATPRAQSGFHPRYMSLLMPGAWMNETDMPTYGLTYLSISTNGYDSTILDSIGTKLAILCNEDVLAADLVAVLLACEALQIEHIYVDIVNDDEQ
jgi:hypothetical protein